MWFTISFIHSVSHKFKHVIKDLDTRISYYGLSKLESIIREHKDNIPNFSQMNVVYKLSCILQCILCRTNKQAIKNQND